MEIIELADKLPIKVKNVMVDINIITWILIVVLLCWEYRNDIKNGLNR